MYINSKLPHRPNEKQIKQLLLDCLEHHYGDLRQAVTQDPAVTNILTDLQVILERYRT